MDANNLSTNLEIKRLRTLLDAARLLNSTLELKELTTIILEVVRAEVNVERMSVFVVDRNQNMLHSLVAQDVSDREIALPIGTGIAGTVAKTGEVLDIPDTYADPRFDRSFDQKLGYHTQDLFALPVCNRYGEVVGVVELLNRQRPITETDREFLLGISVFIGVALQNAWMHAQVQAAEQFEKDLVTLRDRLAETERVSLMAEMFGNIAHEINNPLAFAMGYAELARDHKELPEQVQAYLNKVMLGIDKTAAAARKFRQFVEEEKNERTVMQIGGALRQISELRAPDWAQNDVHTSLVIESALPVLAYENQMQLVLLYLIKHVENSALQSESNRKLRIHLRGAEDQVVVEIRDGSPGAISNLEQLSFDSAFTKQGEGSRAGLALAIASSIVRRHKGQIRFHAKPGQGTTFIVELPGHLV